MERHHGHVRLVSGRGSVPRLPHPTRRDRFDCRWRFWLRNYIAQRRIDALDEQLKLARRQYEDVKVTVSELQGLVALQEEAVSALRSSLLPTARVEALAQSNTDMQNALRDLANSARNLGQTLTIAGARYRLGIEPLTKKRSGS
jgi:hypothetical protein